MLSGTEASVVMPSGAHLICTSKACKLTELVGKACKNTVCAVQVLRFWEALWANPHHEHFHLFVCVAVLEHHRRAIMNSCQDFDDLLKFCVELSGRIPMTTVLQDADALCKWAGGAGMDCVAELNPAQL